MCSERDKRKKSSAHDCKETAYIKDDWKVFEETMLICVAGVGGVKWLSIKGINYEREWKNRKVEPVVNKKKQDYI